MAPRWQPIILGHLAPTSSAASRARVCAGSGADNMMENKYKQNYIMFPFHLEPRAESTQPLGILAADRRTDGRTDGRTNKQSQMGITLEAPAQISCSSF